MILSRRWYIMGEFSHIICEDLAWNIWKFRVSHDFCEGHMDFCNVPKFSILLILSIGPSKLSHLDTFYWAAAVRWVTQMIADFASA